MNHAVFVHRTAGEVGFVQDPMQPHVAGRSQMRQIPKQDLREYAEALPSGPFGLLVTRGDESRAKRVRRNLTDEEP